MKLISMTDFVLEQKYTTTLDISQVDFYDKELNILSKIRNYARFLKKPLTLGMFVPCDEDGSVLEEPKTFNEKYQLAKERVLFKNCKLEHIKSDLFFKMDYDEIKIGEGSIKYNTGSFYIEGDIVDYSINTIEDLIPFQVFLCNDIFQ